MGISGSITSRVRDWEMSVGLLVGCCGAIVFHHNSQDLGLWLLIVLASYGFVGISRGVYFFLCHSFS